MSCFCERIDVSSFVQSDTNESESEHDEFSDPIDETQPVKLSAWCFDLHKNGVDEVSLVSFVFVCTLSCIGRAVS